MHRHDLTHICVIAVRIKIVPNPFKMQKNIIELIISKCVQSKMATKKRLTKSNDLFGFQKVKKCYLSSQANKIYEEIK